MKNRFLAFISGTLLIAASLIGSIFNNEPSVNKEVAYQRNNDKAMAYHAEDVELEYPTLESLAGKRIAVLEGTIHDDIAKEKFTNCEVVYYKTFGDGILSVQKNKTDAFLYDEPVIEYACSTNEGIGFIPETITEEPYSFVTSKTVDGINLANEFNGWLLGYISSGKRDEAYSYWTSNAKPKTFDYAALPNVNGLVKVGTFYDARPGPFLYNGVNTGFPNEVIYEFCKDNGYAMQLVLSDTSSFIPQVLSGKVDIAIHFISYTEERAETVTFTDPFVWGGIGTIVRVKNYKKSNIFARIRDSFNKTFIVEGRYKLIVNGLLATLLISICGFILANLFGALFCAMDMSKHKVLKGIYNVYSYVINGTPILVIMMILFYIIFGKSTIPGHFIAILGFGFIFGCNLAMVFKSGIEGVDKGQKEASLALGFTRRQTFTNIVLPQAFRKVLPSYFACLIDLIKATSIVGYITVMDLTKAGDIIRSASFEAFFPLIAIALIYFGITAILLTAMKAIQKSLSKRKTKKEDK